MGMVDGITKQLFDQLSENPQVTDAVNVLKNYIQGQANAWVHFDRRFDTILDHQKLNHLEVMNVLNKLVSNNASLQAGFNPAGDDGLLVAGLLVANNPNDSGELQNGNVDSSDTEFADLGGH